MKKFFAVLSVALVATSLFATGVLNDIPQAGLNTFSAASGLSVTNTFPVPYSHAPFVSVSSTTTNNSPFTISSVTKTNFILTVTTGATTNNQLNWKADPGVLQIQTASVSVTGGTPSTNSFAVPFATTPKVWLSNSSLTNSTASVTSSQIIISSAPSQTVTYMAIGYTLNGGSTAITY